MLQFTGLVTFPLYSYLKLFSRKHLIDQTADHSLSLQCVYVIRVADAFLVFLFATIDLVVSRLHVSECQG